MRDTLYKALSETILPDPVKAISVFKKIAPLIYSYERSLRGADYQKPLLDADKIFLVECMTLLNRHITDYIERNSFEGYVDFFNQFISNKDKDNDYVIYKLWIFFILDQRMRTPFAAATVADVLTACIKKAGSSDEAKEKLAQVFFSKQRLSTVSPYGNIFSELTLALVDALEKNEMLQANRISECLKLSITCCQDSHMMALLEDTLCRSVALVGPFSTFDYVSRAVIPFERLCIAAEKYSFAMNILFQFLSRLTQENYKHYVVDIQIQSSLGIKLAEYVIALASHKDDSLSFMLNVTKSTSALGFMIDGCVNLTESHDPTPTAARQLINTAIRNYEHFGFEEALASAEMIERKTSWIPRLFQRFQNIGAHKKEMMPLLGK